MEEAALDIRKDALDMTFKLKGSYAPPAVEQKSRHAVSMIVLDVPRPPRDNPPPSVIELASGNGDEGKDIATETRRNGPNWNGTSVQVKPRTNAS